MELHGLKAKVVTKHESYGGQLQELFGERLQELKWVLRGLTVGLGA